MQALAYKMRLLTPAFLGNAEQGAEWRTPPIKAQLRQWWRVAYAAEHGHRVDVDAMRREEGDLFGVAADGEGESRQSRVRLRLDAWVPGSLAEWPGGSDWRNDHPGSHVPVHGQAYLAYPHLKAARDGSVTVQQRKAIPAEATAVLKLALQRDPLASPAQQQKTNEWLRLALALMSAYGTLGGRSRNGWGSYQLAPVDPSTPALEMPAQHVALEWRQALQVDWPQAIGSDGRALVWATPAARTWSGVLRDLARVRLGLRAHFRLPAGGRAASSPSPGHWLAYPTRLEVEEWRRHQLRLPHALRFKVRAQPDGSLRGIVFHMPCLPPPSFKPDPKAIESVWHEVHRFLDAAPGLERIPA